MNDIQTDYGKGYHKGGATIGVVSSGPSDLSGMGFGVTPILSTRFGKLTSRIDPTANIGKHLGIRKETSYYPEKAAVLKTNKNKLLTIAVQDAVNSAESMESIGYSTTYDGKPWPNIGMGSINYTVSVGDLAYGWANTDHVEPDGFHQKS